MSTETQNQELAQTQAQAQEEINIWGAIDILCQAVEAAQAKGGVYSLKDAALLSRCVDIARGTLDQVLKAEQQKQPAAQPAAQPAEQAAPVHGGDHL